MNLAGTYRGYFCFMDGELYVGMKDGQPHMECSFPPVGEMHNPIEEPNFDNDRISFATRVNGLDAAAEMHVEGNRLVGEMYVKEVDMRFKIDMEKISDEYSFGDHHYIVTEENRNILRSNSTYTADSASVKLTYDLANQDVLKAVQEFGIRVENHHDFATILELMKQVEAVVHQDGVNYCHNRKERGTIAQLSHAKMQNGFTNCRGIAILFSGILRAYGFRSSYVECWPADPQSPEIHVVCEVYLPDLAKYVMVDISSRMVYFKDGIPLSLVELQNIIATGEESKITCNDNPRHPLDQMLAYMSKNLMVFFKQCHNNETQEIDDDNSICLVPVELKDTYMQSRPAQYFTSNLADFYPEVK